MGDRLILEIPSDWWMSSNSRMHWASKARRTRHKPHSPTCCHQSQKGKRDE